MEISISIKETENGAQNPLRENSKITNVKLIATNEVIDVVANNLPDDISWEILTNQENLFILKSTAHEYFRNKRVFMTDCLLGNATINQAEIVTDIEPSILVKIHCDSIFKAFLSLDILDDLRR